jgi:hypothetical protein
MSHITTEQMKSALATAYGINAVQVVEVEPISIADVVADTAECVVATFQEAGSNVSGFFDRVQTRYKFNRAVRKGVIEIDTQLPSLPAVAARPARAAKAR